MKYLFLVLASLFFLNTNHAQQTVPTAVEDAFTQLYASVENPFWEYREGAHVAMFSEGDALKKVFFDSYGQWIETRTRMELTDLPMQVARFVDQHYGNAEVTYAGKVDRPYGIFYRVESELPTAIIVKVLNEEGNIIEQRNIDLTNTKPVKVISYPLP